jgi:Protein of unknown function (DUF732)
MADLAIRSRLRAMSSRQVIGPSAPRAARRGRLPRWERGLLVCLVITSGVLMMLTLAGVTQARADSVAYLIDVTVRPGYGCGNPDDALAYGQQLCDKVSNGSSYTDLVGDVQSDFHTDDQLQASCLIDKAVNELCSAQIWQLRNTAAAHHQPHGP